jgi:hypothetical protein
MIRDAAGNTKAEAVATDAVCLSYHADYNDGDRIVVSCCVYPVALALQFDAAIPCALVYLREGELEFPVPVGRALEPYPPGAFGAGEKKLSVSLADKATWAAYRNLSVNPLDRRGGTTYYPHCTATVETRDESVFAARNTIDGVIEPSCHGEWPYQSWGDAEDPRAEIMVEFGRTVELDKAVINLRADFPHDSYWKKAALVFSDGSRMALSLKKTGADQEFIFTPAPRRVSWVKLAALVKNEDDSPFPALTQWAFYGKDVGE